MKNLIILHILITLISLIESEFRYVYIMFRHGARASLNKKDIFGTDWKEGELTNVGKRMLYLAGLNDRKLYDGFLGQTYDINEIYAFSTNHNRTIESLEARVHGLYNSDLINKNDLNDNQLSVKFDNLIISPSMQTKISQLGHQPLKNNAQIGIFHNLPNIEKYDYIDNTKTCPAMKDYYTTYNHKEASIKLINPMIRNYKEMLKNLFQIEVKYYDFESKKTLLNFCDSFV